MTNGSNALLAARGTTDAEGRLLSADPPLADLQARCGGHIPGLIAIPELLELVRQSRSMGLGLAREFAAFDGDERVSGFVRVQPQDVDSGNGCEVHIENWHRETVDVNEEDQSSLGDAIDRATAEFSARLDSDQHVQAFSAASDDLQGLAAAIRAEPGKIWTDYIGLKGVAHRQPLHWRLLDSVACEVPGSARDWTARLLPIGSGGTNPRGFELLLVAKQPRPLPAAPDSVPAERPSLIGEALTPALRDPINRIIGNAETIRGKLAGPVRQEYSEYAGDIADAGQHLLSLLDDLADLEAVEAEDFDITEQDVELGDVARRAAAMLSQRARDKAIAVHAPGDDSAMIVRGEFRRILQIVINLLGNAISYSPRDSAIVLSLSRDKQARFCLTVADEGPGLSADKQARIFDKFERLGRDGDGGSGLGLYISRRLANAMHGDIEVESEEGQGARFILALQPYE